VWAAVGALLLVVIATGLAVRSKSARIREEREKARAKEKPPTDVSVIEIKPRTVTDALELPAVLSAWEEAWVSAEVGGTVSSVEVDEGDRVAAGDVLCRIDDADYRVAADAARASLDRAKAAYDAASTRLQRTRRLRSQGAVGEAELDSTDAAERQARAAVGQAEAALRQAELALERTAVRSPLAGTVSKVAVSAGELLAPGKKAARVVDAGRLRVAVGIPERDVNAVRDLDSAEVRVESVDRSFRASRVFLGVEPEERARVYRLELAVENPEGFLRPGMFAKAEIIRDVREGIVAPLFSVIALKEGRVVYVEERGLARRREVELGLMMGGTVADAEVEIANGLSPGDRLIVIGHRRVDDGDRVKVVDPPEELAELLK
jgi:membrane fusion protein (multidrug efflux system)